MINKFCVLFLSFSILSFFVKSNLVGGPCASDSEQLIISNVGSSFHLSLQRTKVVISHVKQTWCLSDETTTIKKVINPISESYSNVVFYCGNSHYLLEVLYGRTTLAEISIGLDQIDVGDASKWDIVYLPQSQKFSIRTKINSQTILALSAISSNPLDNLTLKPFNEIDSFQLWTFKKI